MSDEPITIYHNPRCSKSRQTLALLEDAGISPRVIEYLDHPPTAEELATLANQLIPPAGDRSPAELLAAMAATPILIERPIVVRGNRAVLGRPPENVHQLL